MTFDTCLLENFDPDTTLDLCAKFHIFIIIYTVVMNFSLITNPTSYLSCLYFFKHSFLFNSNLLHFVPGYTLRLSFVGCAHALFCQTTAMTADPLPTKSFTTVYYIFTAPLDCCWGAAGEKVVRY